MQLTLDTNQVRDWMRLKREAILLREGGSVAQEPRNLEKFGQTLDGWVSLLKACDVPAAEQRDFDDLCVEIAEAHEWAVEAGFALSLMQGTRSFKPAGHLS